MLWNVLNKKWYNSVSLSGVCLLWRLGGCVEHRGAGVFVSPTVHVSRSLCFFCFPTLNSCGFSLRLRWSVGRCCRRQTTSATPSLCVGYPFSLEQGRSVTQQGAAVIPDAGGCWYSEPSSVNNKPLHVWMSVFSCSCWNQSAPVWAGILGSRRHAVWWSSHTGEDNNWKCLNENSPVHRKRRVVVWFLVVK